MALDRKVNVADLHRVRGAVAGGAIGLLALVSSAFGAASPSQAPVLEVGVPTTTQLSSRGPAGWFRIGEPLLAADEVRFTVDSDGGRYSGVDVRLCLAPATDDFDQADREGECSSPGYTGSLPHVDLGDGKYRRTLVWDRDRTDGFLIIRAGCGACSADTDTVTVGLESHTHAVRVGTPTLVRAGARLVSTAAVRLTDNTNAPNGLAGYAKVGFDGGKPRTVATGVVTGGRLRLRVAPPRTARRATVRMCVQATTGWTGACSAAVKVAFAR